MAELWENQNDHVTEKVTSDPKDPKYFDHVLSRFYDSSSGTRMNPIIMSDVTYSSQVVTHPLITTSARIPSECTSSELIISCLFLTVLELRFDNVDKTRLK